MNKAGNVVADHLLPKYEATAIILAGGRSSRLGFDKQLLMNKDCYVIDQLIHTLRHLFQEVIVVSNRPELYAHRNIRVVTDRYVDVGPLAGFHSGLSSATFTICYVTACDMPFICEPYIHYLMKKFTKMLQKDIIVTRRGTMLEPLGGLYRKRLATEIDQLIQGGERRIQSLFSKTDVEYVPERIALNYSPDWNMFDNINTQKDLEIYRQQIKEVEAHVQDDGNRALGK